MISQFYNDGYQDRVTGIKCSPPDAYGNGERIFVDISNVYAIEYMQGWHDADRETLANQSGASRSGEIL